MMNKPQRVITDPIQAAKIVRRKLYRTGVRKPLIRFIEQRHGSNRTTDHFSEDWDTLIILDACRYDAFAAVSNLDGELDWKLSSGSATLDWLRASVGDREFFDTVYVSANPRISRYEGQFHYIDHVWDWGWDNDLNVTPPEPVTDAALRAVEEYPNKRLLVHYMQPHTPYIGPISREELGISSGDEPGRRRALGEVVDETDWGKTAEHQLQRGEITARTMIRGYRENLEIVLREVDRLLDGLSGRAVVSADHGEVFGERGWPYPRRVYGHPNRTPAFKLRQVPWLVSKAGNRRTITMEPPETEQDFDSDGVRNKLHDLGYLDA